MTANEKASAGALIPVHQSSDNSTLQAFASTAIHGLSLEERANLQRQQALELSEYMYDLNAKRQQARPKRTVNTYQPKQKEFIVSIFYYLTH